MSLKFDNNDNGVSGSLNLGQSIIKKFTLKNTGTVDAYGKINWYNLVNTYTTDSLTWTLEKSTTENGTYTMIGSGKVPTSSSTTTKVLKNGLLVPVSTTYYYKLTITLNNLDINQSSDINASMHSQFSLEAGQEPGTDKIMNLVAGEPTNTTDVITKAAPSGASCTNTLAYDGTGKLETRIKLIRSAKLGGYSWDSSDAIVNYGEGINDWTQADLMYELNGDYLDTTLTENTTWYNGTNNQQTGVFDITKRLGTTAQSQIGNAKWYLGGIENANADQIPSTMYILERGTKVWGSETGQTCNDGACPRATSWTGKVALIYPSDYGLATAGGTTTPRSTCIDILSTNPGTSGERWSNNNHRDCRNNDWLKPTSESNWLLSPLSSKKSTVFEVRSAGDVYSFEAYYEGITVLPAVYLKSEVSISGGNGSVSEPYELR